MAKDLALRDKQLLEAAANGYSGVQLEEKFGIPAAEAVLRVKELLRSTSVFDEIEQRQLSMFSLRKVKEQIEKSGIDVANPKHIEAYTKNILAIDRILNNMASITDDQLTKVTEAHAKKMLQMIEAAYSFARTKLKEEYGDFIDTQVMDEAFQEGLRIAASQE